MDKDKADLLQGTLDMLILKALQLEPMHGFGLSQRLKQMSADVFQVEMGSIYPALVRLEKEGWIKGEWDISDNTLLFGDRRRPETARRGKGAMGAPLGHHQRDAQGDLSHFHALARPTSFPPPVAAREAPAGRTTFRGGPHPLGNGDGGQPCGGHGA
jgi:hypothetical protein